MNLFRGRNMECYNCVLHKTTAEGVTMCGVNNELPYRREFNGKRVRHPAWDCEYFIEKHPGNESLEFIVRLRKEKSE